MTARPQRIVMSRLLRPGEKDDGSFDREFWRRAGTNAVLDAMNPDFEEQLRDSSGARAEPR